MPAAPAWVLLAPSVGRPHPDIEIRIAAVTKKIAADPANAELYLRRGELHRQHRDWKKALADYTRAEDLDSALAEVHLSRGKMLFDADRFTEARSALDRFVSLRPRNALGFVARARLLAAMGHAAAALEEMSRSGYDAALSRLDRMRGRLPQERFFQRRGVILERAGRSREALESYGEAVAHVDSLPLERRGTKPLVTLRADLVAAIRHLESDAPRP